MEHRSIEISFGAETVTIPYVEFHGQTGGPNIFVSAGMHGDEVNGVYLAHLFERWLEVYMRTGELKGNLTLFPVLNPAAFTVKHRDNPIDGLDLNRQFGFAGSDINSMSRRMAEVLTQDYFSKFDLGVDLHDSGSSATFLPHCRIHKSDEDNCVSCSRNLARIFGTEYILERDGSPHMMAVHLNNKCNTPIITVEIGGMQILHPDLDRIGLRGLKNVLIAEGMIDGQLDLPDQQLVASNRVLSVSEQAGCVTFHKQLGESVVEGEMVCELYDPMGASVQQIVAPVTGTIFSQWSDNQIPKGRTLFSLLDDLDLANDSTEQMDNFHLEQQTGGVVR